MITVSSVLFGDLLRTVAWEIASQIALRNCSKEVRGEVSVYIHNFGEGSMCNQAHISVEGCC